MQQGPPGDRHEGVNRAGGGAAGAGCGGTEGSSCAFVSRCWLIIFCVCPSNKHAHQQVCRRHRAVCPTPSFLFRPSALLQVRRDGGATWLDLSTAQHFLATGTPLPAATPVTVAPATVLSGPAPVARLNGGQGLTGAPPGEGGPTSSISAPPSTASAAAAPAGSGNGWPGQAAAGSLHPVGQQPTQGSTGQGTALMRSPAEAPAAPPKRSYQPPSLGVKPLLPPAVVAEQGAAAQLAEPSGSRSPQPREDQKPAQQALLACPAPIPAFSASPAAETELPAGSWADAEEGEEAASDWETVAARKPRSRADSSASSGATVPPPAAPPARQPAVPAPAGSWGRAAGIAGSGMAGSKAGKKKKSPVGYEDDKVRRQGT